MVAKGVEAATSPASAIGDGKGESEPPKGERTEQVRRDRQLRGDRKYSEQPTRKRALLRHKKETGRAVTLGVQLCGQAVLNNSRGLTLPPTGGISKQGEAIGALKQRSRLGPGQNFMPSGGRQEGEDKLATAAAAACKHKGVADARWGRAASSNAGS